MTHTGTPLIAATMLLLVACGGLEKNSTMINLGDEKERVVNIMGPPDDRQFKGNYEAWQYCHAKTGLGIHDYRIIWLYDGKVTGMNSYKNPQPIWGCMRGIRPVRWEDALKCDNGNSYKMMTNGGYWWTNDNPAVGVAEPELTGTIDTSLIIYIREASQRHAD